LDGQLGALHAATHSASSQFINTNLLRALDAAADNGAPRIVKLTAGLSTTDPIDRGITGWGTKPAVFAAKCPTAVSWCVCPGVWVDMPQDGRSQMLP
jgi:hypothetical protein